MSKLSFKLFILITVGLFSCILLASCFTPEFTYITPDPGTVVKTHDADDPSVLPDNSSHPESTGFFSDDACIVYTISIGGKIDGKTEWFLKNGESTGVIRAVPDEGYYFTGWSDGILTPERSDTYNGSKQIISAEFAPKITLRIFSEPSDAISIDGPSSYKIIPGETVNITVSAKSGYRFIGWKNGLIEQNISVSPSESTDYIALFEPVESIPDFYIVTENNSPVVSKYDYLNAELTVSDLIESRCLNNVSCRVKGHGNSTWEYFQDSKPSYRLKLTEKTNLAGIGDVPGSDYVLLSNHGDATMLRNFIVLTMAKRFDNIRYVVNFRYVNLYLNGEPKGLYLLCEKVKVAKSRINIEVDATGAETDTGYLLEIDRRAPEEARDEYFYIKGTDVAISIKSDSYSPAQKDYISDYVNNFYKACLDGNYDRIAGFADIPSIIDMFILEEFTKERDSGFSSFYMIKEKGGKLRFDCPWDYDLCLGNDNMFRATSKLITVPGSGQNDPNPFFSALYQCDWFKEAVSIRLKELKPVIIDMIGVAMNEAEFLREANKKENELYGIYGRRLFWEPKALTEFRTYDEHLDYLKNWMTARINWLSDHFSA